MNQEITPRLAGLTDYELAQELLRRGWRVDFRAQVAMGTESITRFSDMKASQFAEWMRVEYGCNFRQGYMQMHILQQLLRAYPGICSMEQLVKPYHDGTFATCKDPDDNIKVGVCLLRKVIYKTPWQIHTKRGRGYMLVPPEGDANKYYYIGERTKTQILQLPNESH